MPGSFIISHWDFCNSPLASSLASLQVPIIFPTQARAANLITSHPNEMLSPTWRIKANLTGQSSPTTQFSIHHLTSTHPPAGSSMCKPCCFRPLRSYLRCSFCLEFQQHLTQLHFFAGLTLPPPSRAMTSRDPLLTSPAPLLRSPRVTWSLLSQHCAEIPSQQDCRLKALIGSHSCCILNTEQTAWQRTEQCWLNLRFHH